MSKEEMPRWERQLAETAANFSYPPTPDVAGRVRQQLAPRSVAPAATRRLAWVVLVLLLLATALLAVPAARAALLDFFQIGAIRILPVEVTTTPAGAGTAQPTAASPGAGTLATQSTRTLISVAGATTWEAAQAAVDFPLRQPTYPADLGLPDEVYRQQLWDPGIDRPVIILVWHEAERPAEVALALYQIAVPYYGIKGASIEAITETKVHGQPAYWIEGPHRLQLNTGEVAEWLFVPGNVLIWVEGEMTYRLEGAATVVEAVRIAESLSPPRVSPRLEGGP